MMADDQDRNEQDLLGSILQNEDTDEVFTHSNHSTQLQRDSLQSDSIIEQGSQEKNYFDNFNKSFENMSFGSDQACSPTSPIPIYMHSPINRIRNNERQNSSHSFDGQSFSTQENSMHYQSQRSNEYMTNNNNKQHKFKKQQKHTHTHGYMSPGHQPQHNGYIVNNQYNMGFHQTIVQSNFRSEQPSMYQQQSNQYQQWQQDSIQHNQNNTLIQSASNINEDMILSYDLDNMCGNQLISRKVQKVFEQGRPDQRDIIFNKIERCCVQFSKDVFGNYLVQKVFERGTPQQQLRLFNKLKPHIYELSKNNFGCRVIQKVIEIIENYDDLQDQFIQQLQYQIKSLIYDVYGNYVLLKCLEVLPSVKILFIIKQAEDCIIYMSQQTYGCRIVFKILEVYNEQDTQTLLNLCLNNQKFLSTQEYGNYILQYALLRPHLFEQVSQFIYNNIEQLCMNKYASNTVEKFVEQAQDLQLLLEKLALRSPINNNYVFVNISTNPFGNYVIKKLLVISDKNILIPLLLKLHNDMQALNIIRCSEFGQRVYQILEKLMTADQ